MRFAAMALLIAAAALGGADAIVNRIAAGDFRGALEALDSVSPDHRDAQWHLLSSKAWDGLDDPAKAAVEAEESINRDPHNEAARLQLAQIFLSRNTPDAAYEILSEALPLFPNSTLIRLGLGIALNGMRRYDEAIGFLKDSLRLKPDLGPAFDAMGSAYLNSGNYEPLAREAAAYARTNPRDFRGYYYEAAASEELSMDGKHTESLLRQSIALNPNFAASWTLLGRLLLQTTRAPEAVDALQRAIRLRPNYAPAHLSLAAAYRKLGRAGAARREADEVSRLNAEESRPVPHLLYHRGNLLQAPQPTNQK